MAVGIIYALEVIDIVHDQGQGRFMPSCTLYFACQYACELTAVKKTGETVGRGQQTDFLLVTFELGYVHDIDADKINILNMGNMQLISLLIHLVFMDYFFLSQLCRRSAMGLFKPFSSGCDMPNAVNSGSSFSAAGLTQVTSSAELSSIMGLGATAERTPGEVSLP
ncbi:MAG: hypothetical protein PHG00_07380 [Methylococcales bacterium]|nr:hypothetical protein [Methylococcales bacterium]